MRSRKESAGARPSRPERFGPNRLSGRLLLTGLPVLTAGTAAYAALTADYLLGAPALPTLPLDAMGESLLGSAVILLLGALLLQKR